MKRSLYVGFAVLAGAVAAHGQGFEQLRPVTPENAPPATLPAENIPFAEDDKIQIEYLNGIVILSSIDQFRPQGVSFLLGVSVHGVKFLETPEFEKAMLPYLGGATSKNTLRRLEHDIVMFCRKNDHTVVDVIVPDQIAANGVVQILVIEGKVGKVTVAHQGKHWFSDDFIRSQVRLKTGDSISERKLLEDVNWLNQNPFRDVSIIFKQGRDLGQTDIELPVADRFPLRVYTGYEDTGSRIAGGVAVTNATQANDGRLVYGFNWGNAFGLDHQFNYQFMADTDFDFFWAHSASYIIPLPWRHTLTFLGSYVDAKAPIKSPSQDAVSSQISFRYSIPLVSIESYQQEVSLGFDFKNTDNVVKLSGAKIPPTSSTEISQFVLGYTGLLPDRFGSTTVGAELFIAPGWIDSTQGYEDSRTFARNQYEYARFKADRTTVLPFNFVWIIRGMGQVASGNLLVSEQLGLGGYLTVRGYDEREANGDEGAFVSNELRTPACSLIGLARGTGGGLFHRTEGGVPGVAGTRQEPGWDQFQLLGFWDFGVTENIELAPGENAHDVLSSAGAGFRYTINRYLTMRFDYGWQLRDTGDPFRSRAHISVVASF